jgi:hypothetical protein
MGSTLAMGAAFFSQVRSLSDILATAFLLVGVCAGFAAIYAGANGWARAIEERDAGYTTTFGDQKHLWQLDPKTGSVIRRPGEPIEEGHRDSKSRELDP